MAQGRKTLTVVGLVGTTYLRRGQVAEVSRTDLTDELIAGGYIAEADTDAAEAVLDGPLLAGEAGPPAVERDLVAEAQLTEASLKTEAPVKARGKS